MRRLIAVAAAALVVGVAAPATANHTPSTLSNPVGNPLEGQPVVEDGNWEFIANFPAGPGVLPPLGVDVEPFTRKLDGTLHRFVIMSSMTTGFSIFDVSDPEAPVRVSDYGAAVCAAEAQGQEIANGKVPGVLSPVHGWEDDIQITPNGKIAILATDSDGRCHDPIGGGFELVDVSDPAAPSLLGLVRLRGDSHNSTIDLDRPWLAYNSDSDTARNNVIDVVDFKSCLALDPATCRPEVSRFRLQDAWTVGTKTPKPSACHDITYARHLLYGACVNSTMVLDPSRVVKDGELTGTHLTDPALGADACPVVEPGLEANREGVMVTDCSGWTVEKGDQAGLKYARLDLLTLIIHAGVDLDEDAPPMEDVQISHKADPGASGDLVLVNDERGGGLNAPPGECPGGAIWFFDVRRASKPKVAQTPQGERAGFLPAPEDTVQTEGTNCTSHVFWEWPGLGHLVSAAWYSSGTQVFRYKIDRSTNPATVRFSSRMAYVLPGASTWTSRIIRQKDTKDGTVLYFAATDITRGFDFFKLTLP